MHFDLKNFRKTPKRGSNFGTRLDIRVLNSRVKVDLEGGGVTGIVQILSHSVLPIPTVFNGFL